ncbi:ATP-binding protein [Acetobacter orientalis]|uniref:ATP-binding protein n=1 Tax=Acetobacter orientalis TaxID=146474 RepID=UPI000A381908|nr:ATP-binding protein [Acetobacter orientalis]
MKRLWQKKKTTLTPPELGAATRSPTSEQDTPVPLKGSFRPLDLLLRGLGYLSQMSRRDLSSFCDLATCDEHGLITFSGDYVTLLRVKGLRQMASRAEIEEKARALRQAMGGQLDGPGHAMQFFYMAEPDASAFVNRNLSDRRRIAAALNAQFEDILSERERVLIPKMRHERTWLALWSRQGCLSKQELAATKAARAEASKLLPDLGDGQNPLMGSVELATIHTAFVSHARHVFEHQGILMDELTPDDALRAIREEIYPEVHGSRWTPSTPNRRPPSLIPDEERPANAADALWAPLREQLFMDDAYKPDFSTVTLGTRDWRPVDLEVVSETPTPFVELSSRLAAHRMPWRMNTTIQGTGPLFMGWKKEVATILRFGPNHAVYEAFMDLDRRRKAGETVISARTSFATCATTGERVQLARRASTLEQAIGGWGGASASRLCGDPLAGVMSSIPGIALASTAPATAAPLDETLLTMPCFRMAAPWTDGAALLRANDGTIVPFDPTGSGRVATLDLFVAPSRRGKSMLANSLLLATVLSTASLTDAGPRLPLIGKLDIGDAASGFIDMVRNGLRAEDAHQAQFIPFDFIDAHAYNIFDTEACCRQPLEHHRAFLTNFLSTVCMPLTGDPFEGMNQIIDATIAAAYEMCSDETYSTHIKKYRQTDNPLIDEALARQTIETNDHTTWWDIADSFAARGDIRMARIATQHAVPVVEDLIAATYQPQVKDNYGSNTPTSGGETGLEVFRRYIDAFIGKYRTLNRPTRLDLGDARIVALDIGRVAPEGLGENARQSELMYLLGFQIIGRNFFLSPEEADKVPAHVRDIHRERFREFRESYKRLECDEFQRAAHAPFVLSLFEEAARRAAKLGVRLGLTSQRITDFGPYLTAHSTARFILGTANPTEADEAAELLGLSAAGRQIVHTALQGPRPDGSGAPLLLQIKVGEDWYEMFLLNTLGPVELWALSTRPEDVALRRRVYRALGSVEARRRLSRVFPKGTAADEIERRTKAQMADTNSVDAQAAMGGVVTGLASELCDAVGLGATLREAA